ncbi:hypothetical protein Tco_0242438 [Tanacetum coccineum]
MGSNEETNAAGTDTRPPMLVESDYDSWKIRIHRKKLDSEFNEEKTNLRWLILKLKSFLVKDSSTKKDDLFDRYERFRAIGNESISDYFCVFNKLNMESLNTPYVQIYTHLKAYEPHAKKTLKKQEQSTSIVDPLAYVAHTTSAPALSHLNLLNSTHQQPAPDFLQLKTHATVHDGHSDTEQFRGRLHVNKGNTAPYEQPHALDYNKHVSSNHEDAYDSDVMKAQCCYASWPTGHPLVQTTIQSMSASNAIFEINKLRQQLQGKDDTIRNLDAQINIMKVLNVGSTEGSCDQQALETDRIQLKDTITSLRIQLDGLKVENVSLKQRYDELSQANTHSRTAYTEKLSALTAGNNQPKAQVTGKTSSGPSTSGTPKVLAPGMYNLGSKYIPPPKRANWVKPTPLPKKRQPDRPDELAEIEEFVGGCVSYGTVRVKPTSGASKPVPKRALQNHSSLPAKSANARRVEAHHRTLNKKNRVDSNLLVKHSISVSNLNNVCDACNKSLVFANHNDCLVMCDDSVNVKTHQTKRLKRQPKKEWKPSKNVGKPIKRVWKPISKLVANSKPQWKPTGRHFSLFEKYPLTRIVEPTDMPIELPPSASSSPQITMVSRFTDHKLSDRKAGSKGISGILEY